MPHQEEGTFVGFVTKFRTEPLHDPARFTGPLLPYVLVNREILPIMREHGANDWTPLNFRRLEDAIVLADELTLTGTPDNRTDDPLDPIYIWSRLTGSVLTGEEDAR